MFLLCGHSMFKKQNEKVFDLISFMRYLVFIFQIISIEHTGLKNVQFRKRSIPKNFFPVYA